MLFRRHTPPSSLKRSIECYWSASDDSKVVRSEKIIPDGFVEIVFHFGDPYRICLGTEWRTQSKSLVGGQISRHFQLGNTGTTDILAAKLRPTALTYWFGTAMDTLTDTVADLTSVLGAKALELEQSLASRSGTEERLLLLNEFFAQQKEIPEDTPVERAVDVMMSKHGMIPVSEVSKHAQVGERQLENLFRKYVGLSPKLYSRILRFSYIFERVQKNPLSWSDVVYDASFYDQSHFIRNFRDFTGENPGDYGFDEHTLANFFMMKK